MKFAVVGYGKFGQKITGAIRRAGHDVSVVVEPDFTLREQARDTLACAAWENSEALANGTIDGFEAVWVASPHDTHYHEAERVLNAGKHVVVEKPIALEYAQAFHLRDLAKRRKLLLSVGFTCRYNTEVHIARRKIAEGELGKVVSAHAEMTVDKPPERMYNCWKGDHKRSGGGVLMMNGQHLVDLVPFLLDSPIEDVLGVSSFSLNPDPEFVQGGNCNENAIVVLYGMKGGLPFTLHVTDLVAPPLDGGFQIILRGTNASMKISPGKLVMGKRGDAWIGQRYDGDARVEFVKQFALAVERKDEDAPVPAEAGVQALVAIKNAYGEAALRKEGKP